jgi:hypothetical protein
LDIYLEEPKNLIEEIYTNYVADLKNHRRTKNVRKVPETRGRTKRYQKRI